MVARMCELHVYYFCLHRTRVEEGFWAVSRSDHAHETGFMLYKLRSLKPASFMAY